MGRGDSVWRVEGIKVRGLNRSRVTQGPHCEQTDTQTEKNYLLETSLAGNNKLPKNFVHGVLDCNHYYVEISCNQLCGKLQSCQHIAGYLFYEVICGGVASFTI